MTYIPMTTTELPALTDEAHWEIALLYNPKGTAVYLRLVDAGIIVTSYGWRSGYQPTTQQLQYRAHRILEGYPMLRSTASPTTPASPERTSP